MNGNAVRPARLILLLSLLCGGAAAQPAAESTIRGLVRDSLSGQPLENVNVFLASTTTGTASRSDGSYRLENVAPGAYDLVFSRVGYELRRVHLVVNQPGTFTCNVGLHPRLISLDEVEVAVDQQEWKDRLGRFLKIFLGESRNADLCTLTNAEVLAFSLDSAAKTLHATAERALIIENRALGYRLLVEIDQFRWNIEGEYGSFLIYPRFEKLPGKSALQADGWLENRKETYRKSLRCFLASLVARRLDEEHFRIYAGRLEDLRQRLGAQVQPDSLMLEPVPGTPFTRWTHPGWLRIEQALPEATTTSYIKLDGSVALISPAGILRDPMSIGVQGYWKGYRVADLLPIDYAPAGDRQ